MKLSRFHPCASNRWRLMSPRFLPLWRRHARGPLITFIRGASLQLCAHFLSAEVTEISGESSVFLNSYLICNGGSWWATLVLSYRELKHVTFVSCLDFDWNGKRWRRSDCESIGENIDKRMLGDNFRSRMCNGKFIFISVIRRKFPLGVVRNVRWFHLKELCLKMDIP